MSRRSDDRRKIEEENYDYESLISPGITMLKFGKGGTPHERLFRLSGDLRYLSWYSGWFCKKLGATCCVDLEKVTRIMQGQNTYQFQRWAHVYGDASEKSFSIVYIDDDNKERTLDLVAPSPDLFKLWFGGLKALVKRLEEQRKNYSQDSLFLKNLWDRADRDHSGSLDSSEVIKLIASINVNMPASQIRRMYNDFDTDKNGKLDFQEFIEFMNFLRKRSDLEAIWHSIVTSEALPKAGEPLAIDLENRVPTKDAVISLDKFANFWEEYMNDRMSVQDARQFIMFCNSGVSIDPHSTKSKQLHNILDDDDDEDISNFIIDYAMFANVMINGRVTFFDPARCNEYQDMTKPLSYYYMASSHNTYLEGDQLRSFSSVNRYVSDLLSGCRCVELDCWDGDYGVPIIYHGGTLSGKILFKDVIKAIYEYGFVKSPYPIVLSIENHCSLEQQKTLAKIMIEGLKETLALPMKSGERDVLPSPTELMRKVLIKGKRGDIVVEDDEEEDEEFDEEEEIKKYKFAADKGTQQSAQSKKKAIKTHPDLAAITYLGTGKVKSFKPDVSKAIPCDMMCSYSEVKVNKHVKNSKTVCEWIDHNKAHLSRIYPKGTRIDSSNYMPCSAWAAGNQLVALNYQTGDLPYHINFGKFLENGRCGYVLKPEYMIGNDPAKILAKPIRLVLNIISGSHLPKPGGAQKGEIVDPFVIVMIHGPTPSDTYEVKTPTVQNNGFNPVWNTCYSFDIKNPDMSFVTFHVCDDDVIKSDFICFSSLPVSCIKPGFRNIPLFNSLGQKDQDFEFATLFVRAHIENITI